MIEWRDQDITQRVSFSQPIAEDVPPPPAAALLNYGPALVAKALPHFREGDADKWHTHVALCADAHRNLPSVEPGQPLERTTCVKETDY
jgi:hypothetical protein